MRASRGRGGRDNIASNKALSGSKDLGLEDVIGGIIGEFRMEQEAREGVSGAGQTTAKDGEIHTSKLLKALDDVVVGGRPAGGPPFGGVAAEINPEGLLDGRAGDPRNRLPRKGGRGAGAAEQDDRGLGGIEVLARGRGKGSKGGKEEGNITSRVGQERGEIISELRTKEGDIREAKGATESDGVAAGFEKGAKSMGSEEIKKRGERAALTHTRREEDRGGKDTINTSARTGVGEQEASELKEPRADAHVLHNTEEERARESIVCFAEVSKECEEMWNVRRRGEAARQLELQNSVTNLAAGEEGGLGRREERRESSRETGSEDTGKNPVVSIEESDRAVRGNIRGGRGGLGDESDNT